MYNIHKFLNHDNIIQKTQVTIIYKIINRKNIQIAAMLIDKQNNSGGSIQ